MQIKYFQIFLLYPPIRLNNYLLLSTFIYTFSAVTRRFFLSLPIVFELKKKFFSTPPSIDGIKELFFFVHEIIHTLILIFY